MSEKDNLILNLIRLNPFLSQQEMADELNVSRPALANTISRLIREGKIAGRAYILPEENEIICIGGANVDRKFHLKEKARYGTSNPSQAYISVGGVARNIGENLGRLGHQVRLLTTAAKDSDWAFIKEESSPYINLQSVEFIPSASTGSYTAVIDPTGEMIIAMANMEVYEQLTPDILMKSESLLRNASLLILDLNCPKETVHFLQDFAKERDVPLGVIPVSSPKMNRLPENLSGATWFICNVDEAESYLEKQILSDEDWEEAARLLVDKGVQFAVITWGSKGVMACSKDEVIHLPAISTENIIDVTGAGDSFSSAVFHGWLSGMSLRQSLIAGLVNASKTLQSPYTVRTELTADKLMIDMEEL